MSKRLLVVDDDPGCLGVMVRALTAAGYTVTAARSVTEARGFVRGAAFDALVLDIRLPDGTGDMIAQENPCIPAITVSGSPPADVLKPFTGRELVATVAAKIGGPE